MLFSYLCSFAVQLYLFYQHLNSRWNASSRDVTALRMALGDPAECKQFRQFIRVRGDLMENNLNFWLEVQKYKVNHHFLEIFYALNFSILAFIFHLFCCFCCVVLLIFPLRFLSNTPDRERHYFRL